VRDDWRIRGIAAAMPGFSGGDLAIPSEDGQELYKFDADGRHRRTFDTMTGAVKYEFTYDAGGRLAAVEDGDGNVTTIERDESGKPTAIVAPGGQRTALSLNGNGYLSSIADPAGAAASFAYTPDGLLTSMTDPRGGVSTFTYDTSGKLVQDENAAGGTLTLARTDRERGFTVSVTTSEGRTKKYETDRLASGGLRRRTIEPDGRTTEMVLGTDGVRTMRYPDGTRAEFAAGADPRFGMLAPTPVTTTVTTPSGRVSTTIHQRTVALANENDPLSLESQTDLVSVGDRLFQFGYDGATNTYTSTSPTGRVKKVVVDDQRRPTRIDLPGVAAPITMQYDSRGRLTQRAQGSARRSYTYDSRNRPIGRSDATGRSWAYEYDAADRITQATLPSGRVYRYGYDAGGNRTRLTVPSGGFHDQTYNPIGQLTGYSTPRGASFAWSFDRDKALRGVTLPGGRAQQYAYDGTGRMSRVEFGEGTTEFAYSVDETSKTARTKRTPASGGTAQTADALLDGELMTGLDFGGAATGQYRYSYDDRLFLSSVSLDGSATTMQRDDDNLLTRYGAFTFTRGANGDPTRISDGSGTVDFTYDSLGRIASRAHGSGAVERYELQLDHDDSARIAAKVETVNGTPTTFSYTYDLDGRLTEVSREGTVVERYSYDDNGNRTSRRLGSSPPELATYDADDRLTQRGSVVYTYDPAGFLTGRGGDSFGYSTRGELLQATAGGQAVTYAYDAFGRRVARTTAAGKTQYLYGDPQNVFLVTASRSSSGVLTTYLYDESGRMFALERGGSRYYVATDHLGSPRVIFSAGGVVKTLEYDAFGGLVSDSNPGFELPVGFGGGLWDGTTGLVRFGVRDYDPAAGRWTARDPALFRAGQANLYVFAGNDPVNNRDPGGMVSVEASAYALVGIGIKLGVTGEGFSFCWNAGVGVGGEVELDVLGGLDRDGWHADAEAEIGLGPASYTRGVHYDDCGKKSDHKACVGPSCVNLSEPGVSVKADAELGGEPDVEADKKGFKPKLSASAKATFGYCMGSKW
jgi:RHS repeat-associated protein